MSNNQFSLLTETDGAAKASGALKPRGPIPKQVKAKPAAKPQRTTKAKPTPVKVEASAPKKKVNVQNPPKFVDKDAKKEESKEKKMQLIEAKEEKKYGRVMDRKSGTGVTKNKTNKGDAAERKMEIREGVDKYERSKNPPRNIQKPVEKKEEKKEKKEEKPVEKKEEKPVEKKEEKPVEKEEKEEKKEEKAEENVEEKVEEVKEVVEEEKKPEKKEIKPEDMLSYEEYLKLQETKKTVKAEPIKEVINAENMVEVRKKELVREKGEEKTKKKAKPAAAPKKENKSEIDIADIIDISYVQTKRQPPQPRNRNETIKKEYNSNENKRQYSSKENKQGKPQEEPKKTVPMNSTKKFPSLIN